MARWRKLNPSTQLSPRELEILRLVCAEKASREIARELGISRYTVQAHRRTLLRKTGAENTSGLVVWAVRMGIVKIEEGEE